MNICADIKSFATFNSVQLPPTSGSQHLQSPLMPTTSKRPSSCKQARDPLGSSSWIQRPLVTYHRRIAASAKGFGRKVFEELLQKKRGKDPDKEVCPCGGGQEKDTYEHCCGRYHKGNQVEPDAVTLLRARYCAYARREVHYIAATTHPDNPDLAGGEASLISDLRITCAKVTFKGLEVLEVEEGASPNEAIILFRAKYSTGKVRDKGSAMFEKSRFVKEGERWFYREKIVMDELAEARWRAAI